MSKQCAVCKQKLDEQVIGYSTPIGEVCSGVCQDYVNEQLTSGKINESDTLNEVELLL